MLSKHKLKKVFATFIKNGRNRFGFSQEILAEKLGVTPRWYQKIESGAALPGFYLAMRIIIELKLDTATLTNVLTSESSKIPQMVDPVYRVRFRTINTAAIDSILAPESFNIPQPLRPKYLVRFRAVKERLYTNEIGSYTTYAIVAEQQSIALQDNWSIQETVHDVACDYAFVSQLCDMYTWFQLDPIHLYDCIIDFLDLLS